MHGQQHRLPLSPPLSPLMTNHLARIDEWRHQVEHEGPVDSAHEPIQPSTASDSFVRPNPQFSKGGPVFYGHANSHYSNWNAYETAKYAHIAPANRSIAPGNQAVTSADAPRTGDQVSKPHGTGSDQDQYPVEDEDIELSDLEPEDGPATGSVTVAELRAHNRRLKRFRLTHSQTRYLMSEFARQPRPDAAHRERLSREIPGFSGRQVQVWFQNRRAKLKRLTNDDRERVLRSRALPANFDMTQALQSPFTTSKSAFNAPVRPSVQTSEAPNWRTPSFNTQQHATFTSNHPQYLDRSGYATPPEPTAAKFSQSTPYMATPASLSSKALSPKYTTKPAQEAPGTRTSSLSSNNAFVSRSIQQHYNARSIAPANATSSVTEPMNAQHPRLMHQTTYQGYPPSSYYTESLQHGWQAGLPRPSADSSAYNQDMNMPRLHPHQQSWNTSSTPSASQPNALASNPWYGQQEPGVMMADRGYESINFEPLYRQQPQLGQIHESARHDMQRNAWTSGVSADVTTSQPVHPSTVVNLKPFSAP